MTQIFNSTLELSSVKRIIYFIQVACQKERKQNPLHHIALFSENKTYFPKMSIRMTNLVYHFLLTQNDFCGTTQAELDFMQIWDTNRSYPVFLYNICKLSSSCLGCLQYSSCLYSVTSGHFICLLIKHLISYSFDRKQTRTLLSLQSTMHGKLQSVFLWPVLMSQNHRMVWARRTSKFQPPAVGSDTSLQTRLL